MKKTLCLLSLILIAITGFTQVHVIENGNTGVGTDNPTEQLEVNGDVLMTGSATITDLDGGYHQLKGKTGGGTFGKVINYPGTILQTSGVETGAIVVAFPHPGTYWVNINLHLFDYQNYDHLKVTISGFRYSDGHFRTVARHIIADGDWNAENHTDLIRCMKRDDNAGAIIIGDYTDTHGGGAGPAVYSVRSIQVGGGSYHANTFESDGVEIYLDSDASRYSTIYPGEYYPNRLHGTRVLEFTALNGSATWDFITLRDVDNDEFGKIIYNRVPNGSYGDGDDFTISASNNKDLVLRAGNANIILRSNYNVGIGLTNPTERLHVQGNIKASGNVSASCGILSCSDIRFKKDFKKIDQPLSRLTKLNGFYHKWDTESFPERGFDEGTYLGFKAQEVEQEFPEMIHTDKDGYKSVDYSRMSVVLVEAMKEQQTQIKDLQNENEILKTQIAEIYKYLEQQQTVERSANVKK